MGLSEDLISQFVKATKDDGKTVNDTTVYGTAVLENGKTYVKLDGSDQLTPVIPTADTKAGDRVTVEIKNHKAVITGNISSPSARVDDVGDVSDLTNKISEFEIVIAGKVDTEELNAEAARIDSLTMETATVKGELNAAKGDISELQTNVLTVTESMSAAEANIEKLQTDKLDAELAEVTYATIKDLDVTNAEIHNLEATYGDFVTLTTDNFATMTASINDLEANKLSVTDAEAKYANIDFSNIGKAAMEYLYSASGLIENVTIGNGTITGRLVGVTIVGDLIEAGTLVADKLVILGTDGLYYKLNTNGVTTEAEQTEYNSLNGKVILAQSITAEKISVDDLVAFDATIGGFNITENAIYSGVKETVDNTTRGLYFDNTGQMALGDANSFIKYYKDTDGSYKLAISASDITFGSSKQSVGAAIADVDEKVNNLSVGGRNLLKNSQDVLLNSNNADLYPITSEVMVENTRSFRRYTRTETSLNPTSLSMYSTIRASQVTEYLPGQEITFSYLVRCSHEVNVTTMCIIVINGTSYKWASNDDNQSIGPEWKRISVTATIEQEYDTTDTVYLCFNPLQIAIPSGEIDNFYLDVCEWKIEKGNKATDWTPAPEDMATNGDVEAVQKSVDSTEERLFAAESVIQKLAESIVMLVTDGNGGSLMVQTENGWTYNMGQLHDIVNSTSEKLNVLTNDVGDLESVLDILKLAVQEFGAIGEYVKITTYEDEPCIELGENDSDFKLLITNTRILFTEGSGTPAYLTNQSLHIEKAVIEEELQQGEFVWKARSNGNLGLMWKG